MKSCRSTNTSMPGRLTAACVGGGSTCGPQADDRALAIEAKYGSIGCSSASDSSAAADAELDRALGRHVLPAADLAHRAEHLLEPGELGLDLRVLPRRVGLRPGARS